MDPGFAIGVGVLWVLFNIFGRKGKRLNQKERFPGSRPEVPPRVTLPPSAGTDPTQREGVRLQDLLRELGRTLDEASVKRTGQPKAEQRLPPKSVQVQKPSREVPEARSLEVDVQRPERAVVDADDEAEAIAARRIAAAEANARPLDAADHRVFDARIRQQPADATATKGYSMRRLRDAMVWREILGPPVSLREPSDP
jgi:hypothetical protein